MANATPTTQATETQALICSGEREDGSPCGRKVVKTVGNRHYCRKCYHEYLEGCRDEESEQQAYQSALARYDEMVNG